MGIITHSAAAAAYFTLQHVDLKDKKKGFFFAVYFDNIEPVNKTHMVTC